METTVRPGQRYDSQPSDGPRAPQVGDLWRWEEGSTWYVVGTRAQGGWCVNMEPDGPPRQVSMTAEELANGQWILVSPASPEPQAAAPPVKQEAPKVVRCQWATNVHACSGPVQQRVIAVCGRAEKYALCDAHYVSSEESRTNKDGKLPPEPWGPLSWRPGDSAIAAARGERPQAWRRR